MATKLLPALRYQYLATACANIMAFCHGYCLSWHFTAVHALKSSKCQLKSGPLELEETQWLGVVYPIGAITGTFLYGLIGHYFGQRTAILYTAIPNLILWILVMFCKHFLCILIGRLIGGLTTGGMYLCIPLFVTEIADVRIRGALGCFLPSAMAIGNLGAFITSAIMDDCTYPYAIVLFPIVSIVALYFTPETPYRLVQNNQLEKAKKSLIYYNSGNDASRYGYNASNELRVLEEIVRQDKERKKNLDLRVSLFKQSGITKIVIGIALVSLNSLTGVYHLNTNAKTIFEESESIVEPQDASIILGVVHVVGCFLTTMLLARYGRKPVLFISSFGSAIFLSIFAIYCLLLSAGYNTQEFRWLPITCLSIFIGFAAVGLRPICFICIAESLPRDIRDIGFGICMIFINVFPVCVMFTEPKIMAYFGLHAVIWTCVVFCIAGIFISIFVIKERKN